MSLPESGSDPGSGLGSDHGSGLGSDPGSDPGYVAGFRPTHVVPRGGLAAWQAPDPGRPTVPLDAFLPVRLTERSGDWGQVLCSNGWSAWVDARLLVTVPEDPPAAGAPLARTADPRPLIARAEDALGRYRRAVEDLASGRADGEGFRRRTRGLRVGMVVDGESMWLYDAEHERWVHCDGTGLTAYAASSGPSRTPEPAVVPAATAVSAPESGAVPEPVAESAPEAVSEAASEPVPEAVPPEAVSEEPRSVPVGYEPTQVVPQVDRAGPTGPVVDGPPPTRVVSRPPDAEDGE